MNINLKLFAISIICAVATACTTTTSLNRSLVHKEKIQTVNLNHLAENISIELSAANANKKETFKTIQGNLDDFSSNMVLKAALAHNLLDGNAFSDNVIIDSAFDVSIETPYLIPVLTPSIIMSANYDVIDIVLKTSTTQKAKNGGENQYKVIYSSQQIIQTSSTAEKNKQYWVDNPLVLKEKIVNGLYDVAQQFSNDFNTAVSEK